MTDPRVYLVYEWQGADERDWAIIGPFKREEDADLFWHEFGKMNDYGGTLAGWSSMGWEHEGSIRGQVDANLVRSPMTMVETYPRSADEMQASLDRVAFLVGLGFEPTDAVLKMKLSRPEGNSIFSLDARRVHDEMWRRKLEEQLHTKGIFLQMVEKDNPKKPESGEDQRRV